MPLQELVPPPEDDCIPCFGPDDFIGLPLEAMQEKDPEILAALGRQYYDEGIYFDALQCFSLSTAGGSLRGLYNLGVCHINDTVPQWTDKTKGLACLTKAVALGYEQAEPTLRNLISQNIFQQSEVDTALTRARMAVAAISVTKREESPALVHVATEPNPLPVVDVPTPAYPIFTPASPAEAQAAAYN
ncbi:MAG: hypothetical protein SFW62_06640 [Alphaproteobacteria bacterium]|nr:hypothetical protein [Alphaproteobacteria bacterium]